jgi:Domain of unknown function (DUF3846)
MTKKDTTKQALLIDGPRRADWRLVTVTDYRDIQQHLGGSFEDAWVVDQLTVYVHADGLVQHPPFVRAVQKQPNALYPDGVMILHGPVVVMGPPTDDGDDTSFTPDHQALAELIFLPVE